MAGFPISAYLPRLLLARGPTAPRLWDVEGTLVFCDVSGFTRLSDLLARRGREGGEDMVRTLVRIFTVLLSASDDGGDVVKFGGDAMAILYTGPDHARRACHASYVMQRVIDVIGNVELTGARAKLRMSIGVHSGTIRLVLAGQAQEDLVATGRDVTRTLELEAAADSGEILVSPETAAHLRPSELGAVKGPGVLVRRVGSVVSTGSQILFSAPDDELLWRYLPVPFQHAADRLTGHSDHRRAGIAFVAVTGLDEQLEQDPEGTRERLERLAVLVHEAAAETGVTVLDTDVGKDGYKYLMCAGAPLTLEDAEGRIIRALLRITGTDLGLRVQAGCASGRVFAGTVGAPFRSSYTVMGDTTNLAARLCAHAEPGQVLAHEPMLRRSLTEFTRDETRHLVLKGKPDPEPAVPVTGVVGQRGRTMHQVPFVGREQELETIAAAYASGGAVVEVIGEPGLGKSRLANAALSRLGRELWWFTADPYGAQVPYAMLRVLLRRLLDLPADADRTARAERLRAVVAERCPGELPWLPLLGTVLGTDLGTTREVEVLDEQFRAERMRESLRVVVQALLPGPATLVFDDAHWIDQASAEALEVVFGDLADRPWAVLLTRRDVGTGLRGGDRLPTVALTLEPLPAGTAEDLLAHHGRVLRPDQVEALVERAGGNPYFLIQLAEGDAEDLPDTVEELVGARVDELDPSDRDLLRNAAVIGTRFSPELYTAATGDTHFRDALLGGTLAEYIDLRGGEAVFTREIYREVAYGQLTFRGRRQLHRQVAEAIEGAPALAGTARLPMLSLHYGRAGLWERAFTASRAAGDAAAAVFANDEAIDFYARAVATSRHLDVPREELAGLHAVIGDLCQVGGRFTDAVAAYRQAMRLTDGVAERVQLEIKTGRVLDQSGASVRARSRYRRARRLAADHPDTCPTILVVELELAEAASHFLLGRHDRARQLALTAWDTADKLQRSPRTLRARARAAFVHDSAAGWSHGAGGTRFGDLALRMYEELGDFYYAGIACNNLGVAACAQGQWSEAEDYYERGMNLSVRAGDRLHAAFMRMNLAEIRGLRGHTAEAEAELVAAERAFRSMGAAVGAIAARLMRAAVAAHDGDIPKARDLLTDARAEAAAIGDAHDAVEADALELELLNAEGVPDQVVRQGVDLLDRDLEPVARTRILRALGAAHARLGDEDSARQRYTEALAVADQAGATYEAALVRAGLADVGGPDAAALREAAEETFRRLGAHVTSPAEV